MRVLKLNNKNSNLWFHLADMTTVVICARHISELNIFNRQRLLFCDITLFDGASFKFEILSDQYLFIFEKYVKYKNIPYNKFNPTHLLKIVDA